MDAHSHQQEENKQEGMITGNANALGLNPDPVISYDHMTEDTGFRKRYYFKQQTDSTTWWPLLLEEMIIVLLLTLLILTI